MAHIIETINDVTAGGEKFTEFSLKEYKDKILVQSTGFNWFIYRVAKGSKGAVSTLGCEATQHDAVLFARGYIAGI